MGFQAWLLPITTLSILSKPVVAMLFLCIRHSYSIAFYLQTSGPTKRPNSSKQSIFSILLSVLSLCELQTRWVARLFLIAESAYYIAKNASMLHAFWAKLWLLLTRFLQDIPIIHEISHVLLPEQHLLGRGGYIKIQYKLYANTLQRLFFESYILSFHLLGSVHPIKSYNYWVDFTMTKIIVDHVLQISPSLGW